MQWPGTCLHPLALLGITCLFVPVWLVSAPTNSYRVTCHKEALCHSPVRAFWSPGRHPLVCTYLAFNPTRQVKVPTLALLARDDPLCPPPVWQGALARAAESEGIIVAITDQGGHCGWFDGLGAGSWLDKVSCWKMTGGRIAGQGGRRGGWGGGEH